MESVTIADPKEKTLTVKICGEDEIEDLILAIFDCATPTFHINENGELEAVLRLVD